MRFPAFAILLTSMIASADSRLPSHYAKFFDGAATWTYALSRTTWDYDQIENEPDRKKWKKKTAAVAPIVCKVARVVRFANRAVSEVTCDRDGGWKFTVAGMYLATPAGLYRYGGEWPANDATIGADRDHELLIAASPKSSSKRTKEGGDGGPQYTLTRSVHRDAGTWCISTTFVGAPHDGTATMCFGGVITRGRNDISGELDDFSYRVKR